ncbi:uncharacterized protein LAESUDRAFT_763060 [Laetiporus sulphureus 93-53]|uniref:CCHC-type domain-containing protein n=1 Tax=Laetiporus sulphureus 93-53 TaxID=1314785 RepID=A0A165C367_9APHY|nr:uncharacterized protein LAESUDRAFT_763060 [Laetiporus sulphureus 93-53]KZT02119.1 hypothetical protein LAESUDRAFT_763060 [Laetiporus sulphureus 93-53]
MGKLIPDDEFVSIILMSLPESWDSFTNSYFGAAGGQSQSGSGTQITSQDLIAVIRDENRRRKSRDAEQAATGTSQTQALFTRNAERKKGKGVMRPCSICGRKNHITRDCKFRGHPEMKCGNCGKWGHKTLECYAPGGILSDKARDEPPKKKSKFEARERNDPQIAGSSRAKRDQKIQMLRFMVGLQIQEAPPTSLLAVMFSRPMSPYATTQSPG